MGERTDFKAMLKKEWRTVRELRHLRIFFDPQRCSGAWQCYEVCPIGLWTPDYSQRVVTLDQSLPCIACGACVLQCPSQAIRLSITA